MADSADNDSNLCPACRENRAQEHIVQKILSMSAAEIVLESRWILQETALSSQYLVIADCTSIRIRGLSRLSKFKNVAGFLLGHRTAYSNVISDISHTQVRSYSFIIFRTCVVKLLL